MVKNLTVTSSENSNLDKRKIHKLVQLLKSDLNFEVSNLSIVFMNEDEITKINISYLEHNFSTDIITFNYSGENYTLDGEIFISLDDAAYNAKKYKVSLENEIVRLVIHGLLHLVGYDDKESNDKRIMKKIENELVNRYLNILT